MSLWLCLRFEQLPLQCLNRDETRPVAVLEKQRVLRANDCARALGIKPGQGTATVRALAAEMPLTLLDRMMVPNCLFIECSLARAESVQSDFRSRQY